MATYVYAIVRPGHALPEAAPGVGEPPGALRRIEGDEVSAVVGEAPEDLRARRRDVAAHHEVLTALAADGPVLPLRFGMVVRDDAEVRDHIAGNGAVYADALRRLEGKAELNVKAEFELDAVLPAVVGADPQIAAQRERSRTEGSLAEQMRLGEMVAQGLERYTASVRDVIVERLAPLAMEMKDGPAVQNVAANLSFLVASADVPRFRGAVDALREELDVDVRCTGPLPAYSFVPEATAPAT